MSSEPDRSRNWKRTGLLLLGFVAGPPAAFVLLSPLLALVGYATEWFAPGAIGNVVGLILLGAAVVAVFVAAVVAVVVAVLALVGTAAATIGSAIAHVFSRLR
ncbi:hypothetical protein [Methylobacterium haplocladii]|uniref:hypothetical protein n=1 Tax=Methylobacterium haplocladii TaxID=1176176 RepID=UPI0014791C2C|nr:hypothetical protein [Methylobacterium haplocladii]GJD83610.1 hypothetical protein HPGCJGGD_1480 [Methylobacterium haplocladii]